MYPVRQKQNTVLLLSILLEPSEMLMLHFPIYWSKINNWDYYLLSSKLQKSLLKLSDNKKTHMQNSKLEDTAELQEGHFDVKVSTGYLVPQCL